MQRIISTYGKFLLSAVVVLALIVLLFSGITDGEGNRGIFQIVGAHLDTGQAGIQEDEAYKALEIENVKAAPQIFLEGGTGFSVGNIVLTDYVKAVDYAGRSLPVTIIRIENPAGQDITAALSDTGEIFFSESGIYLVEVSAKDDGYKKTMAWMKLPVI